MVVPSHTTRNPRYGYRDFRQGSGTQFQTHEGYVPPYIKGLEPIYEYTRDFSGPYKEDDGDISGDEGGGAKQGTSRVRCSQAPMGVALKIKLRLMKLIFNS